MRRPGEPKHRVSRRFGVDIYGTGGSSLLRRLATPPGGLPRGRRRKPSQFGAQLTEKQKLKAIYGIDERQLRRHVDAASREEGPTGANLLARLERRLDNVVYRLGFARSRPMARQLVSHGHVQVDGRRVTIPSFLVEAGQRVELTTDAAAMPVVVESIGEGRQVPGWLSREGGTPPRAARVERLPRREDVDLPVEDRLVIEFYGR
jgi:small subunit ribosomal protein S4